MTLTVDITIAEGLAAESSASAGEMADGFIPEPARLQGWAQAAYQEQGDAEVSVLVTTAQEVQQLNKQYRDKDKPTNVLSFPMQLPGDIDAHMLGDVILCAPVIAEQAEQQSKAAEAHWAHMVVHGMLHLQGYDHIRDEEASVMEQLEIRILGDLGFDNPYA